MTPYLVHHSRGRCAAVKTCLSLCAAVLTLVVLTQRAVADDSPSEASRQPAAIDHGAGEDSIARTGGEDRLGTAVLPQRSESSTARGRRPKRGAALSGADPSVDERSTPWYRSAIGSLAIVLALVGGAYWAAKRWLPTARAADSGALTVVARTAITPKQSVALLRLGRRYVLVGVSGDRVSTLSEITDADEVAELTIRTGTPPERPRGGFDTLLAGEAADYRGRQAAAPEERIKGRPEAPSAASTEPLTDLLERLRSLKTN